MPIVAKLAAESLAVTYNNRGLVWLRHDFKKSLKDFDKAIELDPQLALAYYNRGVLHQRFVNDEDSVRDFKAAAKLGYKDAQAVLSKRGITW